MLHRISLLAAVVMAALAISVTPAMAGEDDGDPTTPPTTTTPAPAPAPAPAPVVEVPDSVQRELDRLSNQVRDLQREARESEGSGGGGGGGNSGASNSANTSPSFTPVAAQETFTVPQGGVQAGAGGTADQGSDSMLPVGLGLVGLMLAAAGGFTLRRRFVTE